MVVQVMGSEPLFIFKYILILSFHGSIGKNPAATNLIGSRCLVAAVLGSVGEPPAALQLVLQAAGRCSLFTLARHPASSTKKDDLELGRPVHLFTPTMALWTIVWHLAVLPLTMLNSQP